MSAGEHQCRLRRRAALARRKQAVHGERRSFPVGRHGRNGCGSRCALRETIRTRAAGRHGSLCPESYRTGGWRAETARGEFEGRAGQLSVLDLSCELISDEPNCHLVILFLPRSLIEDRLPNLGGLHGSAPTGPYAMLLAEYLDMLARRFRSCTLGTRRLRKEPHAKCLLPRRRVPQNAFQIVRTGGRRASLHPEPSAGANQSRSVGSQRNASHFRHRCRVWIFARRSLCTGIQAPVRGDRTRD